jgi:hypothetical protein
LQASDQCLGGNFTVVGKIHGDALVAFQNGEMGGQSGQLLTSNLALQWWNLPAEVTHLASDLLFAVNQKAPQNAAAGLALEP